MLSESIFGDIVTCWINFLCVYFNTNFRCNQLHCFLQDFFLSLYHYSLINLFLFALLYIWQLNISVFVLIFNYKHNMFSEIIY